ncbi:MAG: formate--tetrahydrofolate ligase [Desulfovibrio piger]|uniref:formate--tetrahydrofolate ligase n=1 Tax=Desulfovibrio piger TaxID=901 RepID=UPI00095AE5B7|nr:formate--tetrahydrofolate ligase [Desulfovibrio piger]OLA86427.1 MAG: formate--tetrahydrofolate ligase [Desulfovibrio piger]
MALDPTKHPDWQIAQDAEKSMKTVETLAAELGLEKDELLPYGHYMGKIEQQAVLRRLADRPNGKYVDVTAITPTPLGEGKSTTTIGLVQGLSKRGVKTTAAIRQPSGGPTMGMKGSAAGGGLAQCIPLTPYSLNFTGDIHAITSAHNLAMVALTSRMQHERNYDDEKLERLSGMRRLNIDPTRVGMGWAMDFCCQALRNVIIGIEGDGRRNDGFMMRSRFDITAASEIMSIMSLARDLPDLRKRLSRVVLAFDRAGNPVTTADLEVDGAMMAWLLEASKPNLIQTIEGQPVLVHAGPFGNIALGQSSIIADRVALKLSDIHVTESGFGSEIGYEKFWNVKCHMSGLKPDAAVIVATVRALKNHGGAQPPMPGRPLLMLAGCSGKLSHIDINTTLTVDTTFNGSREMTADIPAAAYKYAFGGSLTALEDMINQYTPGDMYCTATENEDGGVRIQMIIDFASRNEYQKKIETICREIYGAAGVEYSAAAKKAIKDITALGKGGLPICMAKTQYSLSDNPALKGAPTGWRLHVRDCLFYGGAGLVVPVAGDISLMPGTGSRPAFRNVDVDLESGQVTGLF